MVMEYQFNAAESDQRRVMVKTLAEYFRLNDISVNAAVDIDHLPPPKLFSNPGFGDQKRKQPQLIGVHNKTGELYIGLVKTREDDILGEHSLTEYDLYMDLTIRQKGIKVCLMIHEDRIKDFNSFITHYLHPEFWNNFIVVAYSEDD